MRCQWSSEKACFLYRCDVCGKVSDVAFLVRDGRMKCDVCILSQPKAERLGERARIACIVARAVCRASEIARSRRAK